MQQSKVRESEDGLGLKVQAKEYLENYGYRVTENARLRGKSGLEHHFDLLAERDDCAVPFTIAIDVIGGDGKEIELGTVFSIAQKADDAGVPGKAIIALTGLTQEATELAQRERVKIFEKERLNVLLATKPVQSDKPRRPFAFETKPQLVELLASLSYRVEEKAKIRGSSGVEHSFDILAHYGDGITDHRLGIDFMDGGEAELTEVAFFDTKAGDTGIEHRVIVASAGLSPDARQFAQHRGIKVLEPEQKALSGLRSDGRKAGVKLELPTGHAADKRIKLSPQPEALKLIPEVMARRYNAVPLATSGDTLEVAIADPTDIFALQAFAACSQMRIKPIAASVKEVSDAIDFNYKGYSEIEKQISGFTPGGPKDNTPAIDVAVDAPVVRVLDLIIEEGVKARASDIHIEPEEHRSRVRYRIDGTLHDMISLPLNIHSAVVSRVKILANMNVADYHRPKDGQFSVRAKGRATDVRVSSAPTVNGEMVVLRLLDKSLALLQLSELGFLGDSLDRYEAMLKAPYGMILISGPTGAGKTTTLYASISSLDTVGRNVITIEDPAEYRLKNINQIQVNAQAGVTFATGLRSILRLDPDVIMVGEIRDAETANIAIQAALTGHLVLSSIHASDAPGVLFRLLDLNVEPFLIASAVLGIVAQRMVRLICPDCSRLIEVPLLEQMAYEEEMRERHTEFLYGTSCKACSYVGYRGRTGIFEILAMSDEIRVMVTHKANSSDIRNQAIKEGMVTMLNDGMRKVKAGITTPSEVLRVTHSQV